MSESPEDAVLRLAGLANTETDPVVRMVLTPAQYEVIRTRWGASDQIPHWQQATGVMFWGVPLAIDETAGNGWVERWSGAREPLP